MYLVLEVPIGSPSRAITSECVLPIRSCLLPGPFRSQLDTHSTVATTRPTTTRPTTIILGSVTLISAYLRMMPVRHSGHNTYCPFLAGQCAASIGGDADPARARGCRPCLKANAGAKASQEKSRWFLRHPSVPPASAVHPQEPRRPCGSGRKAGRFCSHGFHYGRTSPPKARFAVANRPCHTCRGTLILQRHSTWCAVGLSPRRVFDLTHRAAIAPGAAR